MEKVKLSIAIYTWCYFKQYTYGRTIYWHYICI